MASLNSHAPSGNGAFFLCRKISFEYPNLCREPPAISLGTVKNRTLTKGDGTPYITLGGMYEGRDVPGTDEVTRKRGILLCYRWMTSRLDLNKQLSPPPPGQVLMLSFIVDCAESWSLR